MVHQQVGESRNRRIHIDASISLFSDYILVVDGAVIGVHFIDEVVMGIRAILAPGDAATSRTDAVGMPPDQKEASILVLQCAAPPRVPSGSFFMSFPWLIPSASKILKAMTCPAAGRARQRFFFPSGRRIS